VAGEFLGGLLGGGAGSIIGGSVVRLFLDDSQFNRNLASAKAKNQTASGSMATGWSKFGLVAQAAAVTAGIALVKFAADSVRAAIEADAMQRKLANSIENSTKVTADAIPVFQAQAQAIRDLTGVDDDAINSMQGFLIQMHLNQEQVSALTPLVVDLSTKMGISLEAAAKAVGKSVNGTTAGLQRMGVVVDKTQAKTDAYGATLKALGVVQGFAAQKAKAEPWVLLSMQFQELQEQVGRELLPSLIELTRTLIPLAKDVAPVVIGAFENIAQAAEGLAAAIALLHGDASKSGFAALGNIMLRIVSPGYNILQFLGFFKDKTVEATLATHGLTGEEKDLIQQSGFVAPAFDEMAAAATRGEMGLRHFANMTEKEISEWNASLREDFGVAEDVFSKLAEKAKVTADQIIKAFIRQIKAQNDYADNWARLNHRNLPDELRRQLADMGLEGANIVAALANTNDRKFDQIIRKWQTTENRANQLANTITGVGTAIDRIPAVKRIQLILDVTENLHGNQLSGAMIQQIRNELMRTQGT
jgi:hypothetical protein